MKGRTKLALVTNACLALLVLAVAAVCFLPAGIPASSLADRVYYNGDREGVRVSLMFNVYWGGEYLGGILDVLEEYGVYATFFIGGCWADDNAELVREIAERGHELGNHGYHHKNYSELSAEEVKEEITTSADLIEELTGVRPAIFAPPSGDYDEECVRAAQELGNTVVLWSVDTIDWRRDGAQAILDRVFRDPQAGDMILMHPVKETAEVLGEIIDGLRERGLEPCRVSDVVNI